MNTTGYLGGIFDGRYVYFSPQAAGATPHGIVLRYDTQTSFTATDSWNAYNAEGTNGLNTKGYGGVIYDGRYLHFIAYENGSYHGIFLRHDTSLDFKNSNAWTAFDASNTNGLGTNKGYQGGTFDGRYIYYSNTVTTSTFMNYVLRYDTQASFTSSSSWRSFDTTTLDATGLIRGYLGGNFDGRYVYFVPYYNGTSQHGTILRLDSVSSFDSTSSWSYFDASNTNGVGTNKGFIGSVYDGKSIYFVPFKNPASHANVLKYDPNMNKVSFDLKINYNTGDGYSNSQTGPVFQVGTSLGVFQVMSLIPVSSEQDHLIVGTYDGSNLVLYLDGNRVASGIASGQIISISDNLKIGSWGLSNTSMNGSLNDVQIYNHGLSPNEIFSLTKYGPCQ